MTTPVPADTLDIVRDWATRDSRHPRPRRRMRLDCRACGACCRDNEVILERADLRRFERAGLVPLTRRRNGKLILRVVRDGKCVHLGRGNSCAIYTYRPDACRDFPPASECCLFARQDELGVTD